MNSLVAVSSLTLLTVVLAAHSSALPQAEAPEGIAPYLQPQRLVHIAGARTINLVCLGQGSPTVVLTAGLNGWSLVWNQVQPPLARRTRVCAWDPAGFGFSSSSPEPQNAIHKTRDLEQTLKGADLEGSGPQRTLCDSGALRRRLHRINFRRPASEDCGRNGLG